MNTCPYKDRLSPVERDMLEKAVRSGTRPAVEIRRANIILLSDAGRSQTEIVEILRCVPSTVWRTRARWRELGALDATRDLPRSGRPAEVTPRDIAEITAMACSEPPPGVARWNHRRLTDELNARKLLSAPFSRETVRRVLVEHELKPWKKRRSGASLT